MINQQVLLAKQMILEQVNWLWSEHTDIEHGFKKLNITQKQKSYKTNTVYVFI